ncbi:discoidin domain-containing protein [Streptomyces sp. NPDC088106]|uniref:discoidin domain-containing protein n=1 Tax=Streptomyces TaxID=1883 RepID=UPI0034154FA0
MRTQREQREQGTSDPQWFSVDLRAVCGIDWVRLVFEGDAGEPLYTPPARGNPYGGTTVREIRSSYPLEFVVETSTDRAEWRRVYRTTAGTGGVVNVQPARPVEGRWVRLTSLRRSSPHRIGLSGFEVYGTAGDGRPAVAVLGPLADGGPPSRPAVIRAVRP